MNVGFSTGCLYRSDIGFDEVIKLYSSLCDTIELSFATPSELFGYVLSEQAIEHLKGFEFISIHAPWKEIRYADDFKTESVIDRIKSLCEVLTIRGIVMHPDTIDDPKLLYSSGLPILLENMDSRKKYGTHPDHIKELKDKYDFGFVFDVQHAYEHDPTMEMAKEMIDVMGNRLKHMHVSGWNESEIHVPTYCADNKEKITKVLELGLDVPKILEGRIFEDIDSMLRKELEYVKNYEIE